MEQEKGWVPAESRIASDRISHGYCPACYQEALLALDRFTVQQERRSALQEQTVLIYRVAGECAL
jgi:hypothetical protein